MNDSDDIFFDEWGEGMIQQLIQVEELALSSIAKTQQPYHTDPSFQYQPQSQQPLPSFSPPRELSQRTTHFDPPKPHSDKDLEIEHLKKELGRATKQIANLEKECLKLKKEKDTKDDQPKDFGILAPDHHKISSNFKNGVSSNDPTVEAEKVRHQEAQGSPSDDQPAYLDLSQKLLAVWGSPTDKRLGSNVMSKLLVGCQRDFHILFGFMSLPSEMTRKSLTDISSLGASLHCIKDCLQTPEAAKVSHLYLALTKLADGTDVLETLIEPLLDLCGMENVVIVQSALCILHTLLKLLLELEKNFGRSELCSGTISSLKEFVLGRTFWILLDWNV